MPCDQPIAILVESQCFDFDGSDQFGCNGSVCDFDPRKRTDPLIL